ncbi:type II toxin-antitoxin system Phd/YefM family antitoxin [Candidatus Glomeribacter gigasporarum]|uniref:type II toxin-antitoxin system Phd/YefM family antitoxin n=1 Tax=Candidatus Glomeribacter gigasporarum TaxID=132144 RepID=UPI0009D9FBB3|nr:type II toxin-antitoxin system prevent-host-death family antitoxin [Candidatus Glomeribacter gigasporarum]
MFTEIGSFDAKTKLSQLLQGIKRGQRYTITLRGEPIADLVPSESSTRRSSQTAIEALRSFHRVKGISPEQVATWIAEGRQ